MTTLEPTDSRPFLSALLQAGPRVGLRYIEADDREAYIELRRSSREHLEQWEPAAVPGFDPFGPLFFERQLANTKTDSGEKFVIVRMDDGALVGHMTIGGIIRGAGQMCHLGYWLGQCFTGQGYMREAIGLTLNHCFDRMRLHRVEANIQPHNVRSIAAVQANGFRYEGLAKGLVQIAGEWRDHLRWAITAEEWQAPARNSEHRA